LAKSGQTIKVRGHTWAGDLKVSKVEISTYYRRTWENVNLKEQKTACRGKISIHPWF
jgi:hypothetical protein